jgi:hypothetical protein
MKRILSICLFLSLSINIRILGQDYLYVLVTNEDLKPISQREGVLTGTESLNSIFQKFGVSHYYQSFPNAKNEKLSNFYEIHLKTNKTEKLMQEDSNIRRRLIDNLYWELKEHHIFPEIYTSDYYELNCNNPVKINDTWIAQN